MEYKMKVGEIDDATDYPILVLSGLTGLGQDTIRQLAKEGKFPIRSDHGEEKINGKEFMQWARSVNNRVDVNKTEYPTMRVNET
jgi:hypothetical protein